MKTKIFYLLSGLLFLTATKSGASELNIHLHDYAGFYIMINHKVIDNGGNSYSIPNLDEGYYRLKVYRYVHHTPYHRSSRLVFSGNIFIPSNTVIHSMISPGNTYVVLSETTYLPAPPAYYPDETYTVRIPMSPAEFTNLTGMISATAFDSSRLRLAKQALSSKYVTAFQVRELMELLSFDSNRLSLAKFAYHRTVDTENYYMVSSALTFNSNKESLFNYIAVR